MALRVLITSLAVTVTVTGCGTLSDRLRNPTNLAPRAPAPTPGAAPTARPSGPGQLPAAPWAPVVAPEGPVAQYTPPPPLDPAIWAEGTWVLSGSHGLALDTGTSITFVQTEGDGREDFGTLRLRASLDHFVLDHISLGFMAGVEVSGDTGYFMTGVRAGAAFNVLPGRSSLWPKVSYVVAIYEGDTAITSFQAYLPLVGHPLPHFFFGFGPAYERIELSFNPLRPTTTHAVGLLFTLGGYWGAQR